MQLATSKKVVFQNCPGVTPKSWVQAVDISPCKREPCPYIRGKNLTYTITFTPNEVVEDSENTHLQFFAVVGAIKKQMPMGNPVACKDHGLSCPLKPNITVTLTSTSLVPKSSPPGIYFKAQLDMLDQKKKMVFCIRTYDVVRLEEEEEDDGY